MLQHHHQPVFIHCWMRPSTLNTLKGCAIITTLGICQWIYILYIIYMDWDRSYLKCFAVLLWPQSSSITPNFNPKNYPTLFQQNQFPIKSGTVYILPTIRGFGCPGDKITFIKNDQICTLSFPIIHRLYPPYLPRSFIQISFYRRHRLSHFTLRSLYQNYER